MSLSPNSKQEIALRYATEWHQGQFRRCSSQLSNPIPYIVHCIGVRDILKEAGVTDDTMLAAALLHDTVEDCDVTHNLIHGLFGAEIGELVMQVTDEPELSREERHRIQAEKVEWQDERSILIKVADRIYNLLDFTRDAPFIIQDGAKHRLTDYLRFSKSLHEAIKVRASKSVVERSNVWNHLLLRLEQTIDNFEHVLNHNHKIGEIRQSGPVLPPTEENQR